MLTRVVIASHSRSILTLCVCVCVCGYIMYVTRVLVRRVSDCQSLVLLYILFAHTRE